MAFIARAFIFDGVPSEEYNLYIGAIGDSGEATTEASANIQLLTQKIFRKPTPLFYGAEIAPVLAFPLSFFSPDEITAQDYSIISAWLFSQQNYKKLRIVQTDMSDLYFNCFLTEPQVIRLGNIIQGFSCTVTCDSPWGWKEPKYLSHTYTGSGIVNETINFFNESANPAYTYPTSLVFTANGIGGYGSITNMEDSSRECRITLSPNEVVTMNCDLEIISSTVADYPLDNFNLNWLRFLRGFNTLFVNGNISGLTITTPLAVKVGG